MKNQHLVFSFLVFAFCSNLRADVQTYQTTDNSGLNKQERIEAVDKYLVDLSVSLKNMESKLAENSKKIQALDEAVKSIKGVEAKQADKELEEKKSSSLLKDLSELDKIKADIISLKNNKPNFG